MDVCVTVPKRFEYQGKTGLAAWISEGDAADEPWSGQLWDFYLYGTPPAMQPGERVYVFYNGTLRGYAPLVRIARHSGRLFSLIRGGDAVAVTIDEYVRGFRGYRPRWWAYREERPFPGWKTP